MDRELRTICDDLEKASLHAKDATRSAEIALERVVGQRGTLRAHKPTLVIDGVERPQTIVFTNLKNGAQNG